MDEQASQFARGRVAIVTGASSGFGYSTVKRLVAAGAKCIATARRSERLEALISECGPGSVIPAAVDVTHPAAAEAILAARPQSWPLPDILINNAGLALGAGPAQKSNLDDWLQMIDTNISGLVRLTHAVLPEFEKLDRADIVNLSSVAASYPYPGGNVYAATKAFVRQFSLGLRADLLGSNVRVTSIEPGMCETEFSIVRFAGDKEKADSLYRDMSPITADDIANVIASILALPPHVNVNTIELMPTRQAFSAFAVSRT